MRIFKLLIPVVALALMGLGCLGGSSAPDDGGVWRSTDAGLNWMQAVAFPTTKGVGSIAEANIMDMVIDPQDHLTVYIGTRANGLAFSYNAGISWMQPREPELQSGTVVAVDVDPEDKCTIYAAKSSNLTKSTDCGRTFDTELYVEARPGVTLTDVAVDWYDPNIVWLSTSDGDIFKSPDGGTTWNSVYRSKGNIFKIILDNSDSRIIYVIDSKAGLIQTLDSGENWSSLEDNLDRYSDGQNVYSLVQDVSTGALFAATEYGLLRSEDQGATWTALDLLTGPKEVDIAVVATDPTDTNKIYYATSGTFYATVDGGLNWQTRRLSTGLTPTTLVIDPLDSDTMYLGVADFED